MCDSWVTSQDRGPNCVSTKRISVTFASRASSWALRSCSGRSLCSKTTYFQMRRMPGFSRAAASEKSFMNPIRDIEFAADPIGDIGRLVHAVDGEDHLVHARADHGRAEFGVRVSTDRDDEPGDTARR